MRIGRQRHRLVLESSTETRDAAGGVTQTWALVEVLWASIDPVKVDERPTSAQVGATATHKLRMRYYSGLTHSMRFKFGSRYFYVVEILNPAELNVEQQVMVREAAS